MGVLQKVIAILIIDEYNAKSSSSLINVQTLHNIRKPIFDRVIIGYLNINSLRNKIKSLTAQITGNVYILTILETKLKKSFPEG